MLIHLPLLLFIKSWLLFRIVNGDIIAKPLFLLNTVNFFLYASDTWMGTCSYNTVLKRRSTHGYIFTSCVSEL